MGLPNSGQQLGPQCDMYLTLRIKSVDEHFSVSLIFPEGGYSVTAAHQRTGN